MCNCIRASTQASDMGIVEHNHTVTVNFPDMLLASPAYVHSILDDIPAFSDPPALSETRCLPEKLQPPLFRAHRCHHPVVEHGDDADVELPIGFPEAVQHISEMPSDVYHVGFYIEDRGRQSRPQMDGGMQAFKCHLLDRNEWLYVTVQRQYDDRLSFNCFKDEEVWITCHDDHEECRGCTQSQ